MATGNKTLARDLGLWSVVAISIGAMMGSGIFILPGLAYVNAGPAVILSFVIAAVLVLPAALAKCEMATAMPEAGGTYIYIERSKGPLMGTIAGLGTWFSLLFKAALALVGGAPYIDYATRQAFGVELPITPLALGMGVALIVINIRGASKTGLIQIILVGVMIAVLAWFVGGSFGTIEPSYYDDFFDGGVWGIIAAAGMVYVSYAGVSNIASVAEEVENPGRNLPLGIILSFVITVALYVGIVSVVVGALPPSDLSGSEISVAMVANTTLGEVGLYAVVVAAIFALISTANAGLLASSRYPFAMSRDKLAPDFFGELNRTTGTPVRSIAVTGGIILALVFVPITEIAKLASAFLILVFAFENLALIAFRNSDLEDYNPSFVAPGYPWLQWFGIVGGLMLILTMGWVPILGAGVIIGGSIAWYFWFTDEDLDREGAIRRTIRTRVKEEAVEATREILVNDQERFEILIALTSEVERQHERNLLRIASDIARRRDGHIKIAWFETIPAQAPLKAAASYETEKELHFERQVEQLSAEFEVPIGSEVVVSHDTKRAILTKAREQSADLLMLDIATEQLGFRPFWSAPGWIQRKAPCDVVLFQDKGMRDIDRISVFANRGPYDPLKIMIAEAIAVEAKAEVTLVYRFAPGATTPHRETVEEYVDELTRDFAAPISVKMLDVRDHEQELTGELIGEDLVIVNAETEGLLGWLTEKPIERFLRRLDTSVLYVKSRGSRKIGLLRRIVWDRIF